MFDKYGTKVPFENKELFKAFDKELIQKPEMFNDLKTSVLEKIEKKELVTEIRESFRVFLQGYIYSHSQVREGLLILTK